VAARLGSGLGTPAGERATRRPRPAAPSAVVRPDPRHVPRGVLRTRTGASWAATVL
jgi:hypothetical protein